MSLSDVIEAAKRQEYYKDDEAKELYPNTTHGGGSQSSGLTPRDSY